MDPLLCPQPGSITLEVRGEYVDIVVVVSDVATATLTARSGPAPAGLETSQSNGRWIVQVPSVPSVSSTRSPGVSNSITGAVTGTVIQAGNLSGVSVNSGGANVTSGAADGVAEKVKLRAELPEGSSLHVAVEAGRISARGHLQDVRHESQSAALRLASVHTLTAHSTAGGIEVEDSLTGPADIETLSGDVDLEGVTEGPLDVRTMSGDITVNEFTAGHRQPRGTVRTTSGRVRVPDSVSRV